MQDFDVKHEMEPEPAAWIRFQSYAQRIRSMSYVEDIPSERTDWRPSSILITDEAWDVIFRSRICMNVLPNLTTLTWARVSHERTWNHQFRFLQALLHNQLRSLTLHIPWRDEETPSICRNIAFRAPQLTHLEIRSKSGLTGDDPDGTQSATFTRMLSALIYLRTITVPAFWITSNVVQAASTLPHLIALTSSPITELNTGEPEDVKTFQPSLSDGCFPSLTTLEIACNIPHAVVFFGGLNHPRRMTNLSVSSPNLVARSRDISELLSALASSYPGLLHVMFADAAMPRTEPMPFRAAGNWMGSNSGPVGHPHVCRMLPPTCRSWVYSLTWIMLTKIHRQRSGCMHSASQ
jgi:hypothetical protein